MNKASHEGLYYYHVRVETTAGNFHSWSGWAASQEDAEGRAQVHFAERGITVHKSTALGHE